MKKISADSLVVKNKLFIIIMIQIFFYESFLFSSLNDVFEKKIVHLLPPFNLNQKSEEPASTDSLLTGVSNNSASSHRDLKHIQDRIDVLKNLNLLILSTKQSNKIRSQDAQRLQSNHEPLSVVNLAAFSVQANSRLKALASKNFTLKNDARKNVDKKNINPHYSFPTESSKRRNEENRSARNTPRDTSRHNPLMQLVIKKNQEVGGVAAIFRK